MKCTCAKNDLRDALQIVANAVPTKPSTPIVAGIYMKAENNTLKLNATNFQVSIHAEIPANIEEEGDVVVVGKFISEIIRKMSGEIVTLSSDFSIERLTLKSDAASFEMMTMDPDDFPVILQEDVIARFRVNSFALKNLISHTVFACSKDDSRPAFTGVNVEVSGTSVKFVATNTHRIAIAEDKSFDDVIEPVSFIVPASTLYHVRTMLNASNDSVTTSEFSQIGVSFQFDNFLIISRVVEGTFPPYDKVIPQSCETVAEIEVADFAAAVERIAIISRNTDYNAIRFNFMKDGLEISSFALDVGKGVEHVDVDLQGSEIDISFNVNYIMDVLKIAETQTIKIGMNQTLTPADFREVGNNDFIYIVTPVRTQ